MYYYSHHIGDYEQDTATLSLVEHGAYGKLMRNYYATEKPLPVDDESLCRICGAMSRVERAAVSAVAKKFFRLEDGCLRHKRIDAEIAAYHAQLQTASRAGHASAQSRQRKRNARSTPVDIPLERKGNGTSTNQEPRTKNQISSPARGDSWPELSEVVAEAEKVTALPICAEAFFNEMEGCGWVNKFGHPVTDWRPLLHNFVMRWKANEHRQRLTGKVAPAVPAKPYTDALPEL